MVRDPYARWAQPRCKPCVSGANDANRVLQMVGQLSDSRGQRCENHRAIANAVTMRHARRKTAGLKGTTIIGRCMQRHRHQEFIRFLNAFEG